MASNPKSKAPPPPAAGDAAAPAVAIDQQSLQQLLAQNQQMLQVMINLQQNTQQPQQAQQAGQPAANAGNPAANTAQMKPVPPEEFTGPGYEAWKRRLEDWQALFANLDAAQKAPLLKRALKGDAAAIARAAVPNDQLHQQDAFDRILHELDRHYGTRSQIRQFTAFLNLLRLENQADGNLEVYLRKWSVANATLAEEGLDLPDTIKAFLILANAHLREQQLTQVLTSVEQMGPGQPVS